MSEHVSAVPRYNVGKDAAARERAERLMAAKKKLKTYRARQSKNLSIASSSTASSSVAGPSSEHASPSRSNARRDSAGLQQIIGSPSRHDHRRSTSRSSLLMSSSNPASIASPVAATSGGMGVKVGHLRQASRSRHSRGASINKSISKMTAAAQGAVASHAHAHSRSRSRASINMSISSAADLVDHHGVGRGNRPPSVSSLGAFTWGPSVDSQHPDPFQSRPDSHRPGSIAASAGIQHQAHASLSASPLPPPGSHQRRASRHNRQTSVSNFRESLEIVSGTGTYTGALQPATSSFAPSHNATSSFNSSSPFMDVASPYVGGRSTSPLPLAWSNDPAKVLEALKERGRLEMDTPSSPEQTRQNALEALEGKVSAPSEMIDLGNEAEGQLLVAPRSPGFTLSASPAPLPQLPLFQQTIPSSPASLQQTQMQQLQQSPMIGLGVGVKRNSWSAPGPVTAQGAIGAMGLGSLAEEEEEDEEEALRRSVTPVSTPPRKARASPARSSTRSSPARSSPRKRPDSMRIQTLQQSSPARNASQALLFPAPSPTPPPAPSAADSVPMHSTIIPVMVDEDEEEVEQGEQDDVQQSQEETYIEPGQPAFKPPRMRPLSLSSPGGSVIGSANMSPSNSRSSLRALSPATSSSAPTDERAVSPVLGSSEKPHLSHFHTVAIATVNGDVQPPVYPSPAAKSTPYRSGGLRSLSIGANVTPSTPSPGVLPGSTGGLRRAASASSPSPSPATGVPSRTGSSTTTPNKRSSIGYLNSSPAPSLAQSADGGSASRRPWRSSLQGTPAGAAASSQNQSGSTGAKSQTSPSGQNSQYAFAFGGFGDLEQEPAVSNADELPSRRVSLPFGMQLQQQQNGYAGVTGDVELQALRLEIAGLKTQIEQLKSGTARLESGHALEMAEFEKKTGEEARAMKARMSELEAQIEQDKVARRFEVEGLQREVQQAKDAIEDLSSERDSLAEDVDGWRERCLALEKDRKKEREDEALQQAQIKLIGEMRDQIYGLASALEREKNEAASAKAEVERLVLENTRLLAHRPLPSQSAQQVAGREQQQEPVARPMAPPPRPKQQQPHHPSSGNIPKPKFQPPPPKQQQQQQQQQQQPLQQTVPPPPPQGQRQAQQIPSSPPRHRAFNLGASDGSILSGSSTSASFGRSYSGNTTDTSVATDQDDTNGLPSGHSSFSAVGSKGRESDFGGSTLIQLQTLTEEEEEDEEARADRLRHASGSTGSTSSQELPLTPSKEAEIQHNRSHSFVRHWSFPKGSVSSVRISSEEEHRFFDLDRHASLPPLPFDAEFPPFVDADLTVEEEDLVLFDPLGPAPSGASHAHRPSSPRPADRMNPHARRFSGQFATRAPPVAPSALAHAAMSGPSTEPNSAVRSTLSRLSFGYFGGGWNPATIPPAGGGLIGSDLPSPATARRYGAGAGSISHPPIAPLDYRAGRQDGGEYGEDRDFALTRSTNSNQSNRFSVPVPPPPRSNAINNGTGRPPSSLYSGKPRGRYIKADEVKRPKQSRLSALDFTPACCADRPVYVI